MRKWDKQVKVIEENFLKGLDISLENTRPMTDEEIKTWGWDVIKGLGEVDEKTPNDYRWLTNTETSEIYAIPKEETVYSIKLD